MTPDPELEARLRALADADAPPVTTTDAVEHIVQRRARGERVALPTEPPRRRPGWLVLGAAAAVVASVLLYRTDGDTGVPVAPLPPAAPDTGLEVSSMGGFMLPAPLLAQATREPRYPRVAATGGERLRPGRWFYNSPMLDRPPQPGDTSYGYAIERTTLEGAPAWLALGGRRLGTGRIEWGDSTWLSHDSLQPLLRHAQLFGGARVEEIYRQDEVLIGETLNGYTSWRHRSLLSNHRSTEGFPIRWYDFLAAVQNGELEVGWRRSLDVPFLVLKDGKPATHYLDLEVFRAETVTVPAGTFECWKVGIGREDQGHMLWVDRRRGWIVAQSSTWGGRERYRQELVWGEDGE